ncbi:aldehyde dehydrogenase domain-containing protein [Xylogone sp. PMI_703]|nr:aldehyde dehydrogenase domain-containing protein [Xylogone sp. PMI_703]
MMITKISYTGSTTVGKIMQKLALDSNMRTGGKSPAIVLADADIENAVGSIADGFLFNSSQDCVAGSRLFVQERIAPAFIKAIKNRFEIIRIHHDNSPLATERHFKTVKDFIDIGKKIGAPIIGGARKGDKGYYVTPTVFLNPDRESPIYKKEIFGQVLSIIICKIEEEAIELANDPVTGLSGTFNVS